MSKYNNQNDLWEKINNKLNAITIILFFNHLNEKSGTFEEKIKKLVKSQGKKDIWELCNGNNSITQIAKKLGRQRPNISRDIITMVEEGIIFEIIKGSEKFPLALDKIDEYIIFTRNFELIQDLLLWLFRI